ncbi:MAG TPA: aspartate--tRNA ligase [Bacillota bacterium]|nr:aspartate--tRNA ligase [Bacillota bacterium]
MEKWIHDTACGELRASDQGREVILNGWVQRQRNHGGLLFIDLRDRSGFVQVVFDQDISKETFLAAETIRSEYVVSVTGHVRLRPEGTINTSMPTGEVEVVGEEMVILNASKTPPIYVDDRLDVDENIRLKYRYIDLRRPIMQRNLMLRHRTVKAVRDFLDANGFMEIETPILTKSTPEGARDYLVPSRVNPGKFYALPQSPQLFKQLLMVSGFERYFQIARCFRDEDLRADRQPEFTQIDMEMSFVDRETVTDLMEAMIAHIYQEILGITLPRPFPKMDYDEAMSRYGSDKPDTRFGMEIQDITDTVRNSSFQVFRNVIAAGGVIKAIVAPGCGNYSRRELDELSPLAMKYGAKGLAYFALTHEGVKSPIAKFFSQEEMEAIFNKVGANQGDLIMLVADQANIVHSALGGVRLEFGHRLNLIPENQLNFLWVINFPLLEFDEKEHRYVAVHHPFTSPRPEDLPLMDTEPAKVRANAYDLVLNGVELGGGSIRIHRREIQEKLFKLLGFTMEDAYEKWGYLLEAFEYGTPPHGGLAFGLDRLIMLMAGVANIREVIAFPKTASATCLLTSAPAEVDPYQLKELHIQPASQSV